MLDQLMDDQDSEKDKLLIVHRNFRLVALVALIVLVSGAVFYHYVEDLGWIDAFYFCTITLTTVGYGDITPHTDIGKIFTIFYVLVGIGILATFANLFLKNAVAKRYLRQEKKEQGASKSKES